eukprot:67198-Rhodomonas_salina.1
MAAKALLFIAAVVSIHGGGAAAYADYPVLFMVTKPCCGAAVYGDNAPVYGGNRAVYGGRISPRRTCTSRSRSRASTTSQMPLRRTKRYAIRKGTD